MTHHVEKIVALHNEGEHKGLYSVCSSSSLVLRAAVRDAVRYDYPLIIESTANQVNQFGGYTGMLPKDFVELVTAIALDEGMALDKLILGGDHLGPLTWTDKTEDEAMKLASDLIRSYVVAGYTKIHIDTSMKVADDLDGPLDPAVCARRGALLAQVAQEAFKEYQKDFPSAMTPVFIVGSEVPVPGGSHEFEDSVTPTEAADFLHQVDVFEQAFKAAGVDFSQVAAFVVQPGVEFGDDFVYQYDPDRAQALMKALSQREGLVFEGHSTDYQTVSSLTQLVRDGVCILKVGPAFTFRLREALYLLEEIEKLVVKDETKRSCLKETLLSAMDEDPKYWMPYYKGSADEVALKKSYSYSDRCRYYLPLPSIQAAIDVLFANLPVIPEVLVSQYFPLQYKRLMEKNIQSDAQSIALDYIQGTCHEYAVATGWCDA